MTDFYDNNIIEKDTEIADATIVHYFRDGHDEWIPYAEAFEKFQEDVAQGNNSRIWTVDYDEDTQDQEDIDCIHSYGSFPT